MKNRQKKFALIALAVLVALLISACSSPISVAGDWAGTATTDADHPITMDLEQTGTQVSGTFTDVNPAITMNVDGSVSGQVLSLSGPIPSSTDMLVLEGEIDGNTISGNLELQDSSGTTLDSGTFTVTRN